MAEIGRFNKLKVVKKVDFGVYLDGGEHGEILIPRKYVPKNCRINDILEVFVYLDSNDKIIATTQKPLAIVGEFAFLKVADVNPTGAFLDWGLDKDLLVPYNEQKKPMDKGKKYVVKVYLDVQSNRCVASSKIGKFLDNKLEGLKLNTEVKLLIYGQTESGYLAIVNNTLKGMLYKNEIYHPVRIGQRIYGYIKKIREDHKLDLSLYKPGYDKVEGVEQKILEFLRDKGGFMQITDKSSPEVIKRLFKTSKRTYKKAIGGLYKEKLISIEEDGIRLNTEKKPENSDVKNNPE